MRRSGAPSEGEYSTGWGSADELGSTPDHAYPCAALLARKSEKFNVK